MMEDEDEDFVISMSKQVVIYTARSSYHDHQVKGIVNKKRPKLDHDSLIHASQVRQPDQASTSI